MQLEVWSASRCHEDGKLGNPMKKKILIVDDDADVVTALHDRLAMVGYETLRAWDGIAALQILEQIRPDLMLLDLEMPHMNGLEVLKWLARKRREGDSAYAIPVVIITAYVTTEQAAAAIRAGIVGFVAKPFAWQQLITVLREAMTPPSCLVPATPANEP
jgi:CheY-like chemotaxis protein